MSHINMSLSSAEKSRNIGSSTLQGHSEQQQKGDSDSAPRGTVPEQQEGTVISSKGKTMSQGQEGTVSQRQGVQWDSGKSKTRLSEISKGYSATAARVKQDCQRSARGTVGQRQEHSNRSCT